MLGENSAESESIMSESVPHLGGSTYPRHSSVNCVYAATLIEQAARLPEVLFEWPDKDVGRVEGREVSSVQVEKRHA